MYRRLINFSEVQNCYSEIFIANHVKFGELNDYSLVGSDAV
jgi:hypothetical protein